MNAVTDIFPEELKKDINFKNYLLKYSAYTFYYDDEVCKKTTHVVDTGIQEMAAII